MPESSLPSWRLALSAAKQAARVFPCVLKNAWVSLLLIHAASTLVSQCFTYALDAVQESGREDLSSLVVIASLEMITGLLWSTAWVLVLATEAHACSSNSGPASPLGLRFVRNFNRLLIEQVRVLAAVLWRVPLLIFPAFIEYVRLAFVALVVLFEPAYKQGTEDALQRSRKLTRGRFWLLALTLTLSVALPWVVEDIAQAGGSPWIWENPLGIGIGSLMTLAINCGFGLFLWSLFWTISRVGENHADLRLETNPEPGPRTHV